MELNRKYLFNEDGKAETYEALYRLVCQKDRYTGWHSRNVADMALQIGERAGLPKNNLKLLYTAALLHDVGKIMVDNVYLLKPDRLTDVEFLKVKLHPLEGAKILETFDANRTIIDGAWHHHERWDGGGYPDGLERNGAMFTTRIITMADSYDAMATERPYKEAMPTDEIRQEFIKGRGKQFDPILTEIMLDIIDDKRKDNLIEYLLDEKKTG